MPAERDSCAFSKYCGAAAMPDLRRLSVESAP